MRTFGMPYMGSKSRFADEIVDLLPPCETLYDLFAGGCAITHCALLREKFERYVSNDIKGTPKLFWDVIHRAHHDDTRWFSREDFFCTKELFAKICFSYGTNLQDYIYGEDIEDAKLAMHEAVVNLDFYPMRQFGFDVSFLADFGDWRARRIKIQQFMKKQRSYGLTSVENEERLQHLQHLENLERLERLERLEQSYETIKIRNNSVIYCDIPYKGTADYGNTFNHDDFYEWALSQTNPVFISSYEMPDEFECIYEKTHFSTLAKYTRAGSVERVFIPRGQKKDILTLF